MPLVYDEESYKFLVDEGVDPLLASHVAHLFIRDPLVIYQETMQQDDTVDTDHFEVRDLKVLFPMIILNESV